MLNKLLLKIIFWVLKNRRFSLEEKGIVTMKLIEKVNALPISSMITFDSMGNMIINGRKLEIEQSINFKQSCLVYKDNYARTFIREQLKYQAIQTGVHQGLTTDMIIFSKAGLWIIEEEDKLLQKICG
jgi:hypothetical protein